MDYIAYVLNRLQSQNPHEGVLIGGSRLDKLPTIQEDVIRHWIGNYQIMLNSYPPPDRLTRQQLLQQRFISYEEYLTIFDDDVPRTLSRTLTTADHKEVQKVLDLFHVRYPAYELFGLADEKQRQIFLSVFRPKPDDYYKTMKASQTYLATFFFQMV